MWGQIAGLVRALDLLESALKNVAPTTDPHRCPSAIDGGSCSCGYKRARAALAQLRGETEVSS